MTIIDNNISDLKIFVMHFNQENKFFLLIIIHAKVCNYLFQLSKTKIFESFEFSR